MIRKAIPVLTHVDNLSDMKIDMSAQEETLQQISDNQRLATQVLTNISTGINHTNIDTTSLVTSVGVTTDESTENTVIGLLKSIANKLS